MKARISEIFESTQGEGIYFGTRQLFIRFFGCNLSCRFCDTKLSSFKEYEVDELFKVIKPFKRKINFISFTGGEPLLHYDFLKEILALTKENGFKNYLETNGTLSGELKEVIDDVDVVAMDLKLPSSSGMGNLWGLHRRFLKVALKKEVFLKAVICQNTEEKDLEEAVNFIKESEPSLVLVLQPDNYENNDSLDKKLEEFKNFCTDKKVTTCVIPQLHKKIGIR